MSSTVSNFQRDHGISFETLQWERASSRDDGGTKFFFFCLFVFLAVAGRVGFLSSYDGELRDPLVWPQGSPVSIQVVRGSATLLSSHSRGIGPQDTFKGES